MSINLRVYGKRFCVSSAIGASNETEKGYRWVGLGGFQVWASTFFSFLCGSLSHTDRKCGRLYESSTGDVPRSYCIWMKAGVRRGLTSGERWFCILTIVDGRRFVTSTCAIAPMTLAAICSRGCSFFHNRPSRVWWLSWYSLNCSHNM